MTIKLILMNLYIDYTTNHLSALHFSAEYGISEAEANILITAGKNLHELENRTCEMGVKNFIEQNGLKKSKYKASELLPILQKNNAYGLEKFKTLITF